MDSVETRIVDKLDRTNGSKIGGKFASNRDEIKAKLVLGLIEDSLRENIRESNSGFPCSERSSI